MNQFSTNIGSILKRKKKRFYAPYLDKKSNTYMAVKKIFEGKITKLKCFARKNHEITVVLTLEESRQLRTVEEPGIST